MILIFKMCEWPISSAPSPVPEFWAGAGKARLFRRSLVPRHGCQSVEIVTDSTNTSLWLLLQLSIWLTGFYQYLRIPLTASRWYRFSVSAYTEFKLLHLMIILYFYISNYREKEVKPIPQIRMLCLEHFVLVPREVRQKIATVAFATGVCVPKSL